jgi:hypothetical protein
MEQTYTIGAENHLLYQNVTSGGYGPPIQVLRYTRFKINPELREESFLPRQSDKRLPLTHITIIYNDSVMLDKGTADGIKVGDQLLVFRDETLRIRCGSVLVTEAKKHESTATVVGNTGAIRPEDVCIIVRHHARRFYVRNSKRVEFVRDSANAL